MHSLGLKSVCLVLKNIPKREWSFRIAERRSVLGRSSRADIPVPARFRSVSRRHAELWMDRRGIWMRDLGSTLGTNVNGVWVDHVPKVKLAIGDRIWFGTVEANLVARAEQSHRPPLNSDGADLIALAPWHSDESHRHRARQLSRAEIEVMLWLSRGFQDDGALGRFLFRSPHTVRTEIGAIFRKLDLHSRAEVLAWLRRTSPL